MEVKVYLDVANSDFDAIDPNTTDVEIYDVSEDLHRRYEWGVEEGYSIFDGLPDVKESYMLQYVGSITFAKRGPYTFNVESSDPARVIVGGTMVVETPTPSPTPVPSESPTLIPSESPTPVPSESPTTMSPTMPTPSPPLTESLQLQRRLYSVPIWIETDGTEHVMEIWSHRGEGGRIVKVYQVTISTPAWSLRSNAKQPPPEYEQNVMLSAHYVNVCLPCFRLKNSITQRKACSAKKMSR
jgi:hypothetical protein